MKKYSKHIYSLIVGVILLSNASCIDDKGNYNYTDYDKLLPIELTSLEPKYEVESQGKLTIKSPITKIDNESNYTYSWTIYSNVAGNEESFLLSEEKDLDIIIHQPLGDYRIEFKVLDKELGIYKNTEADLTITGTLINQGWYVLKGIDGETDFDYIKTNAESPTLYADVLKAEGQRLKGSPISLNFQRGSYHYEEVQPDGTVIVRNNRTAMHIASSDNLKSLDLQSLKWYKDFNDQFYNAPDITKVQNFSYDVYSWGSCLINNGKIYTLVQNMPNVGKFGLEKSASDNFFPSIIMHSQSYLAFDINTRSFYNGSAMEANSSIFQEDDSSGSSNSLSPSNMNMDMVDLIEAGVYSGVAPGVAIMKERTTGEYYYIRLAFDGSLKYPFIKTYKIPANSKLTQANFRSIPKAGEYTYFGYKNELYVYYQANNTSTNTDNLIKRFPAGETIACIKNIVETKGDKNSYLCILTNSTAGWKLYVYKTVGNVIEIEAEPTFVYTGEGKGHQLYLRES